MGSDQASRHDKQTSGKLQREGGVEQEEEDQEKDEMVKGLE